MKTISTMIAGAALMAASSAFAQSSTSSPAGSFSTDGYYIYGYVEYSYFDDGTFDDTLARADVDMGVLPAVGISNFPIGFSLGIDGFWDDSNNEYALYPAVTFALGNGLISAGIPRSVSDKGYIPDRNLGGSSLLDLELSTYSSSYLAALYLFETDFDPYGVRYDGEFGNTKVGASYHYVDDVSGNVDFYALAFQHQLEAISSFYDLLVFGGIEYIDVGSSNATNYELGVEGGTDKLRAGVSLGQSDIGFGGSSLDRASIYADYKIIDELSINGTYSILDGGGSSVDFYSLGLEYKFLGNGYVRTNYTDSNDFSDPLYELTVGWRF